MKNTILIIFLVITALVISACALNKTPITADDFYSKLTELGFSIEDITEQYEGAAIIAFLASAPNGDFRLRFIEFSAKAQAEIVFTSTSESFDQFSGSSTSFTGKNWASRTKTVGNEFVFLQYIENTFIFTGGSTDYKQDITDIMKELEKVAGKTPPKVFPASTTATEEPASSESAVYSQESYQNNLLYGIWVNENNSNTLTFVEPNIFIEEGGTSVDGGMNSFLFTFDGSTLTIFQGNDSAFTPVTINDNILTMGPFEGENDWHYNLFLWGTFIKTQ